MPTAFCTTCGSRRHGDHRFCTSCGQPFDPPPSRHDDPEATASKPLGPSAGAPAPRRPRPGVFPAPPAARSRGPLVAAAVGGLALVVVASAVTFTLVTDGGRGGGYTGDRLPLAAQAADGATQVDLLSEPTSEWSFSPDDIYPGGEIVGILDYTDGLPPVDALAFGDVVVTSVSDVPPTDGTTIAEGTLVGLDATTGDIRWQLAESGAYPSCMPVAADTALACLGFGRSTYEEPSRVTLVDPVAGEVVAQTDAVYDRPTWASGSEEPYLVEFGDFATSSLPVHALDPTTLDERWAVTLDTSLSESELYPVVDEDSLPGQVVVSGGGLRWQVDETSGTASEAVVDTAWIDDGYRIESDYTAGTTRVTDLGGYTVLSAPGDAWWGDDYDRVRDGRVGIGDTWYDLVSGEAVWTDDRISGDSTPMISADDRFARWMDEASGTQLLDLDTGDPAFDPGTVFEPTYGSLLGDDAAAAIDGDGRLTVHDMDGGAVAWTRDVWREIWYQDEAGLTGSVLDVAGSMVVVGAHGARGFTGFPAAGDDADAEAAAGEGEAGTEYVTDCGTEPELTPVEAVAADGGVRVTFEMTATCPDGQWLAHDAVDVTMDATTTGSDGTTSTERLLSGRFDFATDPRWVPADGTEQALVFPPGSAFGTPEEVNDAIVEDGDSGEVVRVGCEREDGATPGPVPADPGDAASGEDPVTSTGAPDGTDGDPEETALETLQRIAAKDAPYLDQNATGGWIAQLSSKDHGLVADGLTWTYEDILAEHLRLRLRYPETRLAWSTDWGSFQEDGYWVTVVATEPTPTPRPVLDFCVGESFDRDHCFAKRLARGGSSDGMIRMLPEA